LDFNIGDTDTSPMETEQLRTFLAVAAHGSFLEAANRLHVTQSTVSARVQGLETYFSARLFVRNRAGAALTPGGRRLLRHAKALLLTLEQARHEVGLPSRFTASITVGARIALWEGFLPRWLGQMRQRFPELSIRSEIGFEEDLMRGLVEGNLDLALMYTPYQAPTLQVEHLFDETLVLVATDAPTQPIDDRYVYVEWGPAFYAQHSAAYPDLESPALRANIGWLALQLILENGGACFLPERMAEPYVRSGRLHLVEGSPRFRLPAYLVYPLEQAPDLLAPAVEGLREVAATLGG